VTPGLLLRPRHNGRPIAAGAAPALARSAGALARSCGGGGKREECQPLVTVCVPPVMFQCTTPPGLIVTVEGVKETPLAVTVTIESVAPLDTFTVPTMPMLEWKLQW
jgi:hypothetical protein